MNTQRIFIFSFIILTSLIITSKLYYIQIIDKQYKVSAKNNAQRHITQYPARGIIFDRNGELLVYNQPVYDLKVVPRSLGSFDTTLLCELTNTTKEEIRDILKNIKTDESYKPITLIKQISAEEYAQMQEYLYRLPEFYIEKRTVRTYPKKIAAHVLGYVGEVNKTEIEKDNYYIQGDYIGKSGIEKTYEEVLRGKKGVKIFLVNVKNSIQGSFENGRYDTAAYSGINITSTIDAELQEYAESLLQNKRGSVVAIEPESGEILVLASSPAYDPNLFAGQNLSKNYSKVANGIDKPLNNRALQSQQPPGSTFKPLAALIALQEQVMNENTIITVSGGYKVGAHTVKDHIAGSLNIVQSIQHSSNAFYCHVLKRTLSDKKFGAADKAYTNWKNHIHSFGLGVKLGTDLAYEQEGILKPASYFDKYYGKGKWNHNTIISLAIGQGEMSFTPLQLANMTAVIANQGYYITPHIIKNVEGQGINPKYITRKYTHIDKKYFPIVIDGMKKVVDAGTARSAYVDSLDICGKTGTAQNPHGADHSIFIAFAPKDDPKIAIAVYIENGGFGSTWAAPIASLCIEKFLNDSISRPWVEKRILKGVLTNKKAIQ